VTETKPPHNIEKSPFAGLFKKHPWLVPLFMMLRRITGILREFIDVHVKPFV
jgi:hypothetical protein